MKSLSNFQLIEAEMQALSNSEDAKNLQRFFKTGPGEYGENDQFRGIRVPALRKLATKYKTCSIADSLRLLDSPYHEDRMLSLLIWMKQIQKADDEFRSKIFKHYIDRSESINNWDLVDVSAPRILGPFLKTNRTIFDALVVSDNLWRRRMAIIACFFAIRENDFEQTLQYAELLLSDKHDLMHKAVGWMLREVGKRNLKVEETFLLQHYQKMPRTMLRYAIEKFPEKKRQAFLQGTAR